MTLTSTDIHTHLDSLAKPQGSLGQLEQLAVRLAEAQQSLAPVTRPRGIILFAGDHGVVESGVSAWPSAVTTAMMQTIAQGRASSNALARAAGCDLRLVDIGSITPLARPLPEFVTDRRLAAGTQNLALGPAMTVAQFDAAWAIGAEEARQLVAQNYRLLLAGEMGIGNTTPAACLNMLLCNTDAAVSTGSGAGADDAMRAHKQAIVAAVVAREKPGLENDPKAAIAALCGFEIAAMAGFYAAAAQAGATILLDGYVTTAAALIAERLMPGSAQRMIAAHLSAEPGHRAALDALGLVPILEWQMRLGEGSGALVALPLLDAAAALLGEVATLAEVMGK
ncbi:nicotinate-nucleotide--dimethylbenzimidazole phosphoribosyltransferase [Aquisediminimonas sediminicola]|uniref:nicotinate-nucleotide--dimethylbenzimidazole phosphoribosyltransferase n=1 Tax=Alteraquisediminimonas sediminicola TaxID=2676787 RepID=UPI001C8E0CB8|nr:nicotinate-nucleotide--dimethylbenzimidazole phosphoribosyltransferase [Aquisediminimonas sediminicola]